MANLPEVWRAALKQAIYGGYLNVVESVGGARGGDLWEHFYGRGIAIARL